MFFYFYDIFVTNKKYETVLSQLENRLIELGINGRIEKFSILKNMKEMIEDGIKNEAHTVIAVGDDETFLKTLKIVALHPEISLGYIPLGENTKLAKILGITGTLKACDILSKRLLKKIDLGKAGNHYWLTSLEIPKEGETKLKCDNKYTVSTTNQKTELSVCNLGRIWNKDDELYDVTDGKLNIVATSEDKKNLNIFGNNSNNKEGIFPVKNVKITNSNKKSTIIIDGHIKLKTPLEVTIKPKAIKLIVGKERIIK